MGIYSKYILPRAVHYTCSSKPNMRQREKVVPLASGEVLEIGVGSGLNFSFYDPSRVTKLWGLEPSAEMRRMAADMVRSLPFKFEFVDLPGEEIPLDANSVDTVLVTYTLCTIPETQPALRGMARVLRPGGKLIFCEHGAAPGAEVRRWQDRLNPIWKRMAGGCHLNRAIPELIRSGGFEVDALDTMYLPGWRPATYNYWGTASSR
jgi:ubiquinone/menaquinone biosynthesis C-methylase UbiE